MTRATVSKGVPPCGRHRHPRNVSDGHRVTKSEPRIIFRCPACKQWYCGWCNGTDDEDFRYCDDCAMRRRRRRERRTILQGRTA